MSDSTRIVTSQQFLLNARDFAKGILVAVLSAVIPIVMESLNAGSLTFNWKLIVTTALSAGIAYLAKNFFTPTQVIISGPEAKAIVAGDKKP
jgi:hypothetical protein